MPLNQRILITGTSSGFGRATTLELLGRGHTVIATMRDLAGRNSENAKQLEDAAESLPGALTVLDLDVTDDASVRSAVAAAEERHGGIDVAWNNAGVAPLGICEGFTDEQLLRALDTNVVGVQRVNRAVLPAMRARGRGLLIHSGSTMGRIVWPFAGPYTTTKFALEGLAESLSYDLAGSGVEVSIVQPGAFPTELLGKLEGPGETQRIDSYGELAARPDAFWGPFMEALAKEAPSVSLVADAVVELVEMPAGERPLRRVIDVMGVADVVQELNDAAANVQRRLLVDSDALELLEPTLPPSTD